jgi:hypothetical protein
VKSLIAALLGQGGEAGRARRIPPSTEQNAIGTSQKASAPAPKPARGARRWAERRRFEQAGCVYLAKTLVLGRGEHVLIVRSRKPARYPGLARHEHRVHVYPAARIVACNCPGFQVRRSCAASRAILSNRLHGYRLRPSPQEGHSKCGPRSLTAQPLLIINQLTTENEREKREESRVEAKRGGRAP